MQRGGLLAIGQVALGAIAGVGQVATAGRFDIEQLIPDIVEF
jgi:hypothetical protein